MAQLYKQFAEGWEEANLDFSEQALVEMFNSESYGTPVDAKRNGYYVGKHWLNVTVTMWKEGQRRGELYLPELFADPRFPHWWLDGIFVDYRKQLEEDGFTFEEH